MLEQIFLTGLLLVEKPTLQLRNVRKKEKQSRLVMDCNPIFPSHLHRSGGWGWVEESGVKFSMEARQKTS